MTDYLNLADEAEEKAAKATPGPWEAPFYNPWVINAPEQSNGGEDPQYSIGSVRQSSKGEANAEFIAYAREAVPRLASAIRELLGKNEWHKSEVLKLADWLDEKDEELEKKNEALKHYKSAKTWKLSEDETSYTYEGNHLHPSSVASLALIPEPEKEAE